MVKEEEMTTSVCLFGFGLVSLKCHDSYWVPYSRGP